MNLFRREIEGALARHCALQIDDSVHFGGVDLAQQALGPAQGDLGLQRIIGVHLQVVGRVVKLQRHRHGNLDGGIAAHAHHNKMAIASETILRARFFRTYLRKKLRSDSRMAYRSVPSARSWLWLRRSTRARRTTARDR